MFDGVEDLETAAAEEIEIDGEVAIDHADERKSLVEEVAGVFDFVFEEGAKLGGGDSLLDCGIGYAEALHVVLRKVDAVLGPVDADVLPEVGELKRGTRRIRQAEALFVCVAAGVEDEAADGVGGVAAVAEHVLHGCVARDELVLPKAVSRSAKGSLGMEQARMVSASATKTG